MLKLRKRSIYTGVLREKVLPITWQDLRRYEAGESLDEIAPHLTAEERMFITEGCTPDEQPLFTGGQDAVHD